MKRTLSLAAALMCAVISEAGIAASDTLPHDGGAESDTINTEHMQEVAVSAVRAPKNAPFAVANIDTQSLGTFSRSGKELPFLLSQTPGVLAWSENGLGIGTSYLRIRGAGDSRINVTIDGVPLNSPEDQCVFWANMNSYASLLGSVQIQRGVGTSTNGDGAFGGTISLSTATPNLTPSAELTISQGSYGTWRVGGRFSTGLMMKHLVVDGAWHETQTDGFVHGTSGRSGSFYGGATWIGERLRLSYKNIGNYEHTGQAWNGVIAGDYDGYAPLQATYAQLAEMGYGRFNSLYESIYAGADGKLLAERYMMKDGTLWDKTTDNFTQNHNIVSMAWEINSRWRTTASLHYTYGYGYYSEFKPQAKLWKYGLANLTLADGTELKKSDFVREKGLEQHTYGALWSATFHDLRWAVVSGLSWQQFRGNHFGRLTYVGNDELQALIMGTGRHPYYDSDAVKSDLSAYIMATLHINEHLDLFADAQYRGVRYKTDGYNDKYIEVKGGTPLKHWLDIDKQYNFFNPKGGVSYRRDGHRAYASVAMSHREPERNNFTDNGHCAAPRAERVLDYEAGYEYTADTWHAGINLYCMDYRHQFVQTGELSDIGEALTTNVPRSYRMGAELTAGIRLLPCLSLEGNLAWSRNRLRDFDEVVEDWSAADGTRTIHYDRSTLAYSPSLIANAMLTFHTGGWRATWHTGGVTRMYLDNSHSADRSIPGYCTSDLNASYTFNIYRAHVREVEIGATVGNVFDRTYAASGFVWYQYYNDGARHSQLSYMPAAGRTVMGNVTVRF